MNLVGLFAVRSDCWIWEIHSESQLFCLMADALGSKADIILFWRDNIARSITPCRGSFLIQRAIQEVYDCQNQWVG